MPADTKAPQLRKKMQLATQCQCLQELDWLIEKRGNVPGGLVCTQSHQQRNYCCGESQVSVNNRCWRKVHTESDFHFEHLEVTKYFWNPLCVLCVQLFSKKQSERNGSPQRTDAERVQSGWQSNQGNQHTETREGRGKKKWALKHWQHFSSSLFGSFSHWGSAVGQTPNENKRTKHFQSLSNMLSFHALTLFSSFFFLWQNNLVW